MARIKWNGAAVERAVMRGVKRNLHAAAIIVQRQSKRNVATGGSSGLHVRTGTLRRSIVYEAKDFAARIGTNLVYARIHELGGVIVPKTAKALVFKIGDQFVSTQKVVIPKRPYLRPALDQKRGEIIRALGKPIRI